MRVARALLLSGVLGALTIGPAQAMERIIVLAAGSLRVPLTEIGRDFERMHDVQVAFTFGASGLLHDRILSREPADARALSTSCARPTGSGAWRTSVSMRPETVS